MTTVRGVHQGTEYTVGIEPGRLSLEVLSEGSPAGGSGSESQLGVSRASLARLLEKLGLDEDGLTGYVRSLRGEEWREFWHLVSEYADSRFTWFETDW